MTDLTHHLLDIDGTRIHAVEQGAGPIVLLVHGFPELWYSWRHQLPVLAAAGYRAVAIDQRGYGRSSKFWRPEAYRIDKLTGDLVGVVKALGETQAVVVGHDWGAPVAWSAAWMYPDIFRGVMGMSVPFSGRAMIALPGNPFGEIDPEEYQRELAGPGLLPHLLEYTRREHRRSRSRPARLDPRSRLFGVGRRHDRGRFRYQRRRSG